MLTAILISGRLGTSWDTSYSQGNFGPRTMPQFLCIINVNKDMFTLQLYTEKV